jgi:hypothetical protein
MAIHTPAPTWIGGAGGRIIKAGSGLVNGHDGRVYSILGGMLSSWREKGENAFPPSSPHLRPSAR